MGIFIRRLIYWYYIVITKSMTNELKSRYCAICKCKTSNVDYSFYMHKLDFGLSDFFGGSRYVYKKIHVGLCEDCKKTLEKEEDRDFKFIAIPGLLVAVAIFIAIIKDGVYQELGLCGTIAMPLIGGFVAMIPLILVGRILKCIIRTIRIIINKEEKIDIRNTQIVCDMMKDGWRLGRRP